jgi:hypothetical protein
VDNTRAENFVVLDRAKRLRTITGKICVILGYKGNLTKYGLSVLTLDP